MVDAASELKQWELTMLMVVVEMFPLICVRQAQNRGSMEADLHSSIERAGPEPMRKVFSVCISVTGTQSRGPPAKCTSNLDTQQQKPSADFRDNAFPSPSQQNTAQPLTLLLADTDRPTPSAGRLAVLTPDAQAPVVPQTTVGADLLQPLQVLAQLAVDAIGQDLRVLAVDDVALPVEEPGRDLVLGRVLDDRDDALEFFRRELTGAVGRKGCVSVRVHFGRPRFGKNGGGGCTAC